MMARTSHLRRHLGEDPCSTLLRARLKDIIVHALIDDFRLEPRFGDYASLRLFGSTLIRTSSSSFPFADRKSEDLDLEVYASPLGLQINVQNLFCSSLRQILDILGLNQIKVETYDGRTVEEAIRYASQGELLDTLRLKLSYEFPEDLVASICGEYSSKAKTNMGQLELSISPPRQITVLTPPTGVLDENVRSRNPYFQYDSVLHYLSKVVTRSIKVSPRFIPNHQDPSTFRPTDIMNIFNICYANRPRLIPFRIPIRADVNERKVIDTSDDLLTLRLLVLCNFAVFGRSGEDVCQINIETFDPLRENNIEHFGTALAPALGRGDVLEPRKLSVVLLGFKRLLEELFPRYDASPAPLYLFPEEKRFLNLARGSISDDITLDINSLRPLFKGRYGIIIDHLAPYLLEALKISPAIIARADRFHELRQYSI